MSAGARRLTVVTTHAGAGGSALVRRLEEAGVAVWPLPLSVHEPAGPIGALDAWLERLDEFDWVALTSARAVDIVCDRPAWRRRDWRGVSRPRIAAVGPTTSARLRETGVAVAVCPADAGAAGLAAALIAAEDGTLAGRSVLWPRSASARRELRDALAAAGARVADPIAYTTTAVVPPDLPEFRRRLVERRIAAVTFLSPSSAAHLAAVMDGGTLASLGRFAVVASVGPTTSAALSSLGVDRILEAFEHTGAGLAARLLDHLGHSEDTTS